MIGYVVYVDINKNFIPDSGSDGITEEVIAEINWEQEYEKSVECTGVNFSNNDNGFPSVAFIPNGFSREKGGTIGNGTVSLRNTNNTSRTSEIVVNKVGRVRIQ